MRVGYHRPVEQRLNVTRHRVGGHDERRIERMDLAARAAAPRR
jgi:hypothetical protein